MISIYQFKFEDVTLTFKESNDLLLVNHIVPNLNKSIGLCGSDAINSINKLLKLKNALSLRRGSFIKSELERFKENNGIVKSPESTRTSPHWVLGVDYSPTATRTIGDLITVQYLVSNDSELYYYDPILYR